MDSIGTPCIPGNATGYILTYPAEPYSHETSPPIIYASDLTIEVALYALRQDASAVITSSGSITGHGAIQLRAAYSAGRQRVVWINSVNRDALPEDGTQVAITNRGVLTNRLTASPTAEMESEQAGTRLTAKKILLGSTTWTCLAPQKTYEPLAGSIIAQSLAEALERWQGRRGGRGVILSDHRMWFDSSAASHDLLWSSACNTKEHTDFLANQLEAYVSLIADLRTSKLLSGSLGAEFDMIRRFFRYSYLFHWNYDQYVQGILESLPDNSGTPELIADCLAASRIANWVGALSPSLESRKSVSAELRELTVPDVDIREDVTYGRARIRALSQKLGVAQSSAALEDLSVMVTLKEWKFALIKILLNRFNAQLRSTLKGQDSLLKLLAGCNLDTLKTVGLL
jgi:hypothetical protein